MARSVEARAGALPRSLRVGGVFRPRSQSTPPFAVVVRQLDAHALRESLLGSRLEDAVANAFSVDPRRSLTRAACVLRYTRDGVELAGTMNP